MSEATCMDRAEIERRIPHRAPMLLVDRVTCCEDARLVGERTFTGDEFFFQGHYPGRPLVPGVILCEFAMQCGAILLSEFAEGEADKVPVATRLEAVKFRQIVRPGDTIAMEVVLRERVANAFFLSASGNRAGQTVVRLQFACSMATLPDGD